MDGFRIEYYIDIGDGQNIRLSSLNEKDMEELKKDMETWEKVQEKMKEQKARFRKYYNPDRKDLSHWISGIVRCEKCGAVLSNQGGFFGCSNRSRGTCKGVGYIKSDKLDGIIFNTLSDITLPNVALEFAEPESDNQSTTLLNLNLYKPEHCAIITSDDNRGLLYAIVQICD